jgi:3-methyladenine DNA glycosylase AlkC
MAEPLKNYFGEEIPRRIAGMISAVYPAFPVKAFLRDSLRGYDALELVQRGKRIAECLHQHLPVDYDRALNILLASMDAPVEKTEGNPMASFLYLPHVTFVARYGLEHFDLSMQAQYELTQRFTAEFSIRPFLERYPEQTLALLRKWTSDPSPHVRRLVSEGTRPRLPWASRLREFQRDPTPVLALLELLKDDPELYVRRSVANNLNDIGKDHPDLLCETAERWLRDANAERRWLVNHALRSAVKRGEPGALTALGFGKPALLEIQKPTLLPRRPEIGSAVNVAFTLHNPGKKPQRALVDFQIHFVKANGGSRPKVFKLKEIELPPGASLTLAKNISLAVHTTRKPYAGKHQVDAVINGKVVPLGYFTLV